ncbi:hypothetical protein AQUCO_04200083v1 [Aquilegia coerulea]|uniref:YqgF/RNase H-like domain-containing protein n=1 Tax=Aquilegia coerulea TaxID=218851 RepID=A0A2G5CPH3_AQUCA|nr:hypothetical protein AQUCO_04200083v1 [Aquilegia coerulea]
MKYVKPLTLFRDLLKASSPERGRLLGLDVGNKYVGLAVSDSHNKIASPLSVLVRKKTNIDLMAKDFQTLISELSLGGLVIGCCYDRQHSSLEAVQVKLFVKDLCKTGKLEGLKYTYWDERFTTKCVEALLEPLNISPVMSKTILDKCAAVGILQDYLDYMQKNCELDKSSE